MFRIEQQSEGPGTVDPDVDARDLTHFMLIRDGGNRTFPWIQHPQTDLQVVGDQSTAPAAGPEWADRSKRQRAAEVWK